MSRWPDPVLRFPRPWPNGGQSREDWIGLVVEADWLWRHGFDTVDIAQCLSLHEADAWRAVSQARSARRGEMWPLGEAPRNFTYHPIEEEESNGPGQSSTAQVNEGGSG